VVLLSRKIDYALLILYHLHQRKEGASAREIAAGFGLSRGFTANILKDLCHQGFVTSHRGVKGGYVLQRKPAEVTLADLMAALDETVRFAQCNQIDAAQGCNLESSCPIKGPIGEIHRRIQEVLQKATLAELFQPAAGSACEELQTVSLGRACPLV
jgi:Rrf2 family transcriptional regulator, cysteine metabolism repressor